MKASQRAICGTLQAGSGSRAGGAEQKEQDECAVSALCACVGGATKLPFNFSIKQRSRQQSRLALSGRRMQLSAAKRKYKTLSSTAGNQAGADEDDDDADGRGR